MSIKNFTEIICILDRSGSMSSIASDTIGGFNTFIESQKKVAGTAAVSLILFDDEYTVVYENKDINSVVELNSSTYVPRGWTALLDAIGKTINTVGERLSNTPEDKRPEKVLVCIVTDGEENSSTEFDNVKINSMITHQREKYSWEFVFLGANQDSFATGGKLGIDPKYTCNFAATGAGVRDVYCKTLSLMSTEYRSEENN